MTSPPSGNNRAEHLTLFADGAMQPDRAAGAGVVALDRWGKVARVANKLLPLMTNNEAEYAALLLAFDIAADMGGRFLEIRMDSEIVVHQMTGHFSVNSPALKRLHSQACVQAMTFVQVRYVHIRRELNGLADALAGEASFGRSWYSHRWGERR